LGLPACASERPVIWFTIASGRAAATASPTDAASSPSITMPSAPSCSSSSNLPALVVVAVTWCPRATSCGTRRRPMTPVPPATNTRITSRSSSSTGSRYRDETARKPVTCERLHGRCRVGTSSDSTASALIWLPTEDIEIGYGVAEPTGAAVTAAPSSRRGPPGCSPGPRYAAWWLGPSQATGPPTACWNGPASGVPAPPTPSFGTRTPDRDGWLID
jgi:hypothetical protein